MSSSTNDDLQMTFWEHLEELRGRILKAEGHRGAARSRSNRWYGPRAVGCDHHAFEHPPVKHP